MQFRDIDKDAILQNAATFSSSIEVLDTDIVFTEEDSLVDWKLEDFRYVPNNGFIGQFVERLFDGNLVNIPADVNLENARIKMNLIIHNKLDNSDYTYSYGTFIITEVNKTDVSGKVSYKSCDLTKLFNINYKPTIQFPCTVIELLNDVCTQVGVPYTNYDTQDLYSFAVTPDGDLSGIVSVLINDVYHNITLPTTLTVLDSIVYNPQEGTALVRSHIDTQATIDVVTSSITDTAQGTIIVMNKVPYPTQYFDNQSFVVINNPFEGSLCRDVVKEISKVLYSSARINEDDKLYFDSYDGSANTVDTYRIIDTNHHYGSVSSDAKFGPVNKVVVGLSNVSGENVYYPAEVTDENIVEIGIWDNPITYTDELRRLSLCAEPPMIGLSYVPLTVKTVGHPWLNANDLIQVEDSDGNIFKTYPFDRTLTYKGFITSTLSSKGSASQSNRDYSYDNSIAKKVANVEIIVDKNNGDIILLSQDFKTVSSNADEASKKVEEMGNKIDATDKKADSLSDRIDNETKALDDKITANEALIKMTATNITSAVQKSGGNNKIRNSVGFNGTEYWTVSEGASLTSSQDVDTEQTTTSGSKFILTNGTAKVDITNIVGVQYTLSLKFARTVVGEGDEIAIELHRTDDDYDVIYPTDDDNITGDIRRWKSINHTYIATVNTPYVLFRCGNDIIEFSDLIVCEGEAQTWSQHADEFYGKTHRLDAKGLHLGDLVDDATSDLDHNSLVFRDGSKVVGELSKEQVLSDSGVFKNRMMVGNLIFEVLDEDNIMIY